MDSSPKDNAVGFASQRCFHQSITLPASSSSSSSSHPRLRVSFATTSNFDTCNSPSLPTALFCGGMGASRFLIWRIDALAKREGVRVLFIDRPGVGGSTAVELDRRIDTWLQVVPAVLAHLGVDKVALISHSAGAIYAVNTLLHLPHLLDQSKPFLGMLTPWVHPKYSNAALMQVVDKLPSALVGSLHHITSFIGGYIAPSIQFSSGMIGLADDLPETQCQQYYDTDSKTWTEVTKLQGKWMREEDMSGISADANLCMQKDARDWGAYTSLPTAIANLQDIYPKATRRLVVSAFFAETDKMIGKGGQAYFEQCWAGANSSAQIDFEAKVVKGTDHDSITLVEKGCLEKILQEVKKSRSS